MWTGEALWQNQETGERTVETYCPLPDRLALTGLEMAAQERYKDDKRRLCGLTLWTYPGLDVLLFWRG